MLGDRDRKLESLGYPLDRVPPVGAGYKPVVVDGTTVYVVEADEYDRSFLALTPTVAVVTNVEADHLDIYTDLADIKRAFAQFMRGARSIVLCADDAGANSFPCHPPCLGKSVDCPLRQRAFTGYRP